MKFSTARFLVPACLVFLLLGSVSCNDYPGRDCIVKRVTDGAKFTLRVPPEYHAGDTIAMFSQNVIVVKELK